MKMNMNPKENVLKLDDAIFKANLEALEERYPELAEKVKMTLVGLQYTIFKQNIRCIPNVMHTTYNEPWYIGQVSEFCETCWKEIEIQNVRLAVFLGFGLGYEVMYFLSQKSRENMTGAVIVFERDIELFTAAMNTSDLVKLIKDPNVHLFVGLHPDNIYLTLREHYRLNTKELLMCGATKFFPARMAFKVDKKYYMFIMSRMLEAIFDNIINFGNCPEDSLIGLENMLDNANIIINNPGVNLLKDCLKGIPAVIVATGPSLNKNMHLLKGLENKALILSVDASFKHLMRNGIKPHMVTSLEREHEVQQFFDGFEPDDVKDVYMSACPVLFNHVYESYTGPKIIVYRNFDHFKWLNVERGIMDIKLSAANMAFKIAEYMGCGPIILIGQDLAYGDDGETHATEVPFSSAGEREFYVKGNVVDKVRTNDGWHNFRKAFEVDVSQYTGQAKNSTEGRTYDWWHNFGKTHEVDVSKQKGQVINSTEGGAYIQGTIVMPFAESIEKHIVNEYEILKTIQARLSEFTEENILQDKEKAETVINETGVKVDEIIQLCIDGMDLCKKHEEEIKAVDENNKEELDKFAKIIFANRIKIQNECTETFQKFLMHVVQSYHLKFEMEYTMIGRLKETMLNTHKWYAFVGDISQICADSLKKARDRING